MSTDKDKSVQGIVSCSRGYRRALKVSVEGNIGSGKSTFLNFCSTRPGITVCPEPVEKWRNVGGVNLLAKFYAEPNRWALPFQLYVGMTLADIYRRGTWRSIMIVERSLLSSRYVLMENLKWTGVVEPAMGHVMDAWYDQVMEDRDVRPHAIVYIRATPSVAYARMQSRSRAEEVEKRRGLHSFHNIF